MAYNPNWPILDDQVGFNTGYTAGTGAASASWTSLADRTRGSQSLTRGKIYELDQIRASDLPASYVNTDGYLDPANGSSPYSPGVLPFRPFQKLAMWPASANLLTIDQATGGEGTPLTGAVSNTAIISSYFATPIALTTTGAWQGTQVWEIAVPANPATSQPITTMTVPVAATTAAVTPITYTFSAYVACVTGSVSPQVGVYINWWTVGGGYISTSFQTTYTLTGNTTPTYTRCQVTGQPPNGAVYATVGVVMVNSPTVATTYYVDGLQWEQNTAASAWMSPGTWYPVMTGWASKWSQSWTMGGVYGLSNAEMVDTFAQLSQSYLLDPLFEQVLSLGPNFFYPLNEPTGATQVTDLTANQLPAPVQNSPYGAGSLTFGNTLAANTAAVPLGWAGPVATFANNATGGSVLQLAETFINIAAVRSVPGPPTSGGWTRMIAFNCSTAPTSTQTYGLWSASEGSWAASTLSGFALGISGSTGTVGYLVGQLVSAGYVNEAVVISSASVCDGNWHLATMSLSADGKTLTCSLDGAVTVTVTSATDLHTKPCLSDAVGAVVEVGSNGYYSGLIGSAAAVGEFPAALTATQIATLYTAFKTAFIGDSTGQRYSRILGWAGYAGPTSIATGATSSMGPATDIVGTDVLTALQAVCDTENGSHFVAKNGAIAFQARTARYNQTSPVYVFGENTSGGEFPYEDVEFSLDTTYLVNQAQITQYWVAGGANTGGQLYQYTNRSSSGQYGLYTLTRTINTTNASEALAAAQYLVSQYAQPIERLETIKLHPSANPSLWPVCLSLELGMRVRVMRRPPSAAAIQFDGFIEQISITWDDAGECFYTLQISPANLTAYGLFTSLQATLKIACSASATGITLNPLSDSATNPARANLTGGQQLVLDLGLSTQETVTIATGGVGGAVAGYASLPITLTAPTLYAHSVGATVCEPLPAGVTSPGAYNAQAIFDQATTRFSY